MKDQWKYTQKGLSKQVNVFLLKYGFAPIEIGRSFMFMATHLEQLAGLPLDSLPAKRRIALAMIVLTEKLEGKLPIRYSKAIRALNGPITSRSKSSRFYSSDAWKLLQERTLLKYGRVCMACGTKTKPICVDHIKSLRRYWRLRLDPDNMQVLCRDCNLVKGCHDSTDWRPEEVNNAVDL